MEVNVKFSVLADEFHATLSALMLSQRRLWTCGVNAGAC